MQSECGWVGAGRRTGVRACGVRGDAGGNNKASHPHVALQRSQITRVLNLARSGLIASSEPCSVQRMQSARETTEAKREQPSSQVHFYLCRGWSQPRASVDWPATHAF